MSLGYKSDTKKNVWLLQFAITKLMVNETTNTAAI